MVGSADELAADDQLLARRAGLGDRAAVGEMFDRHAPVMFRYAVTMLDGDVDAAEEAVAQAWEQSWTALPTFRGEAALRTWLLRITANVVHGARRRRRPLPVDDGLLSSLADLPQHEPAQEVEQSQLWVALEAALGELPWRQRAVWVLRELEGMSYEHIALVLDTTVTVVRGQLHRARATLAIRMAQWR